jgi:hypothetical protein
VPQLQQRWGNFRLTYLLVITAHNEGPRIGTAIQAVSQFLSGRARDTIRPLIALDSPTEETLKYVSKSGYESIKCDFSDVGMVRNFVLDTLGAQFAGVFFVDADDSFCPHWIDNAIRVSLESEGPAIISPSSRLHIWMSRRTLLQLRFAQPKEFGFFRLTKWALSKTNLWGSTMLIKGPVPENLRFPKQSDDMLFEDWEFNKLSLELGVPRLVAQGTQNYNQRWGSRRRSQSRQAWSSLLKFTRLHDVTKLGREMARKLIGLIILVLLSRMPGFDQGCRCKTN